jgi:hypothetical protein
VCVTCFQQRAIVRFHCCDISFTNMRPLEAVSALAIGQSLPARIAAAQAGVNLPQVWTRDAASRRPVALDSRPELTPAATTEARVNMAGTNSFQASAGVIRGDRSMKYLGSPAGFATAVITLVNNTALISAACRAFISTTTGLLLFCNEPLVTGLSPFEMQRKPRPLFRGFKECSIYLRVASLDGSNLSQRTIHTIAVQKWKSSSKKK